MTRGRLTLLVVSALLATSIGPFERPRAGAEEATTARAASSGRGMAGDPAPGDMSNHHAHPADAPRSRSLATEPVADAAAIEAVLARLRARHTALPERERIALARTIVHEARLHSLEPELVIAVIEVESGGYHLAVSHVGAMGLMQLLPATGEELAHKHGIPWMGPDTLFDPTTNVKLGTAYLRELADRYGDVSVALAAYNWGPGRIDRRLRRGAGVPSRYVEQVMRAVDRDSRPLSRRS